MATRELFDAAERIKRNVDDLVARYARAHRDIVYADLRFETVFNRSASATNGEPRESIETESAGFAVTVHAGVGGAVGHGQIGVEIGRVALDERKLKAAIADAFANARQRALASAREKKALVKELGDRARSLAHQGFPPRRAIRDDVEAAFRADPRTLDSKKIEGLALQSSRAIGSLGDAVAFNAVSAMSELRHEIFANTEGSLISQRCAFSQGDTYVVAQAGDGHQEIYDTIGQQRGFEALEEGWRGELLSNASLEKFSLDLAREALDLAAAPVLKPPDGEVVVVTDPHFNALVAHEIVGHPCEADRALKMEAAYAGRSWLWRSSADNEIGKPIGSRFVSACSDPTLDGYGHYRYDHEGTPGRRVMHIEGGLMREFMNSRTTAAALGVEPNGSARASEVYHVPLIRMSNTFFMPGVRSPEEIIGEVERGYYVCGHAIPSIAESRENFRISARRIYEIDHGRIGRLFRSGSVMGDSKRFFLNVDAAGNDLKFVAIPNCGKGQPMQVKRMSNGGPTMRSRARLGGG